MNVYNVLLNFYKETLGMPHKHVTRLLKCIFMYIYKNLHKCV